MMAAAQAHGIFTDEDVFNRERPRRGLRRARRL